MAKRGYKLPNASVGSLTEMDIEEFMAHTTNVNCLSMGKKTCRLLITGGDDHKVNVWPIGKPTSLMSLCGHTSPVESLAFDSAEVLVLAGASTGVVKLWDLEETKMVRGLTGHKSNCTALEFHPFGEFFASGSLDTNLKIWDIRKKGCIHTYMGHTRGISTIRFTPDGRWVVSGGYDNVVKVWDLTAGKLLHDFKFHEGHIRSLEFHPLEFLLATGSADRTVKFWDLETFELIGSSRPEATGFRAITFHPDGRTLFCGSDDSLQVYSWEPVVRHDSFEMGWSTLGDLCISEGKLLGCSYYRNSVGVWVADVAHIQPYDRNDCKEKKFILESSYSSEKGASVRRSALGSRPLSPDYETSEIKNIYVDTAGSNPIASQKIVFPLDASEISKLVVEKQTPETGIIAKSEHGQIDNKSNTTPSIITRDTPVEKDSTKPGKESITFSRTKPGMLLRPAHVRKPSINKFELEKLSTPVESGTLCNSKGGLDSAMDLDAQTKCILDDGLKKSCEENSNIKSVTEKSEKMLSPDTPLIKETCNQSISCNKDSSSVKFVNGVAVVPGRTRTLVEKFEQRERLNSSNDLATNSTTLVPDTDSTPPLVPDTDSTPPLVPDTDSTPPLVPDTDSTPPLIPDTDSTPVVRKEETQISTTQSVSINDDNSSESQIPRAESPSGCEESNTESQISSWASTPTSDGIANGDQTSQMKLDITPDRIVTGNQSSKKESTLTPDRISTRNQISRREPNSASSGISTGNRVSRRGSTFASDRITNGNQVSRRESTSAFDRIIPRNQVSRRDSTSAFDRIITRNQVSRRESISNGGRVTTRNQVSRRESTSASDRIITGCQISAKELPSISNGIITRNLRSRRKAISADERNIPNGTISEGQAPLRGLNSANEENITFTESQLSEGEPTCVNDVKIAESLMQTHDIILSTLRSRLTKLQVVQHFWAKNDIKGAIGALRKLPDHSVQADVISVLMEKMEILTLDLFSGLLPVLTGLMDSKTERHVTVSLEMLLKLVAVFGPMIHSTASAPQGVGVDLHAEQRRESCNQCFMQLQKIQKLLPPLVKRGGAIARCAEELNLVLQE